MIFLDCIVKILVSAAEDKDGSRGEDEERSSRVRGVKNFGKVVARHFRISRAAPNTGTNLDNSPHGLFCPAEHCIGL